MEKMRPIQEDSLATKYDEYRVLTFDFMDYNSKSSG